MKVAKHKWLRLENNDEEYIHIVPESDIRPHGWPKGKTKIILADIDCPCRPKIEYTNKEGIEYVKPLIIHNSFEQEKYLDDIIKLSEPH